MEKNEIITEAENWRWFLIEHECGSLLTIRADKLPDATNKPYLRSKPEPIPFECPSCSEDQEIRDKIGVEMSNFLSAYKNLTKTLKEKGFNIREIQSNELAAMKNLRFKSD